MKRSQVYNILLRIEKYPRFLQKRFKNFAIGRAVPFVRTAGIKFEKTDDTEWVASIANRTKVGNHLRQLHACAMVLLAESIAIMIVAKSLPADKLPLVRNINADFVKRSTGALRGRVFLTEKQIDYIQNSEKGEIPLEVEIMDEAGVRPVLVTVTAVWIPKKKNER